MAYDVLVVGTGPAGCTAAHRLADAGVRVALIERERLPRYKTCGGGLVARARAWLPGDIRPAVEHECHTVSIGLEPHLRRLTCHRPEPLVTMTMRQTLDHLLVQAAVSRGAELLSPCRVTGIETDGATVRLATDRGPLSAAFVVAADGATGTLAKAAGWDAARSAIPALELEASVDQDTFARFAGTAWFDFGIPSAGYAWVFPKARHLSIGVLSTRRGRGALTHSLQIYLDRLGIVPRAAERHGYVIPIRPVRAPLVRNRTIAVGDAAGLADPLTAEGISYAALSARLAAEALLGGTLDEERVRVHYTRALRRQVFPGLRAARLLARVVYGPRLQHLLYRTVGDKLADAVADVTLGTRSYAAALLDPHTYLARRQEVAST